MNTLTLGLISSIIGFLIALSGFAHLVSIDLYGVEMTMRLFIIIQVIGNIVAVMGLLVIKVSK